MVWRVDEDRTGWTEYECMAHGWQPELLENYRVNEWAAHAIVGVAVVLVFFSLRDRLFRPPFATALN